MGGFYRSGTVYRLTGAKHRSETLLHSFEPQPSDGANPLSELLVDQSGNLYGTTIAGGSNRGGTAFKLTHGQWNESILYNFCLPDSQCRDGSYPASGLSMDSAGNLFGTTTTGGADCAPSLYGSCGVAFRLSHSGGTWQETVIYTFCQLANCRDGGIPVSGLTMDGSGNLYGTAYWGGHNLGGIQYGGGTIFELTDSSLQTLYSFCALTNCSDGDHPGDYNNGGGEVLIDNTDHLFGTTSSGGQFNQGTVFELTP
jgi:hypothetical protein